MKLLTLLVQCLALFPLLLPAILMRGRKSSPVWYIVSAVGVVSAFIPLFDPSDDSGGWWALPWDTLWVWLFVTIPIGILGIAMLVDRIVALVLVRLRRPRRAGVAGDGGFDPFDDGEPQ